MNARTLVISPNWIGDAVMAQPLLQLISKLHPARAIDVLAPPSVAPVWRAMIDVDTVLESPFRHGPVQLRERWKFARLLAARGYQDAYVLPNTLKYALIPLFAGIGRRVGYKGEMRYGLINVMHHDDTPPRPMVPFYAALAEDPHAALRARVPRPSMRVADDTMKEVARRHGIEVAESELIGLVPETALSSDDARHIRLPDFSSSRTVEGRIREVEKLKTLKVEK